MNKISFDNVIVRVVMFDVTFEIYGCCMIDYIFSRLCLKDLSFTMAISFESVSCCILMNNKSDCSKTTLKERHWQPIFYKMHIN